MVDGKQVSQFLSLISSKIKSFLKRAFSQNCEKKIEKSGLSVKGDYIVMLLS